MSHSSSNAKPLELAIAGAVGAVAAGVTVYGLLRGSKKTTDQQRQTVRRVATSFHPTWHPPQKQPPKHPTTTLTLDPNKDLKSKYNFFISAYIPRPIALVSTVAKDGAVNLAPFSYSGIANHDPGTLIFSCVDKRKDGGDTLKNVKATKECVIHVMSEWYVEAANHSCGNFAPDVDEFVESGLTKAASVKVRPPRVLEAALSMECVVEHILPIENDDHVVTATIVVAKVVLIHVHEAVYDKERGVIVADKLRPMARLGGNTYATIGDIFDIARPKVS